MCVIVKEGEKDKLTLRGSNINVFHFESKIYEIGSEDEEVVNSNGPIFHEDVHRSSYIFHFYVQVRDFKFLAGAHNLLYAGCEFSYGINNM